MTAPLSWREGDEIATGLDMAQRANRDYGPVT